ncbi:hypothetical protein [Limosilactobacillus caccae]|jgi:hypothetical protein|uniref:hypothetical protein n=1 Tax=Limosilactobacillus caccae TaxID=1926284 RepID=UPI000970F321|nr:hypothetical protein [Limosilactobacillus caccae]
MGLLLLLLACWLLWKLGILAVKFIGIIFVFLLIGLFIHVLLWPAIIIGAIVLFYGALNN